MIIRRIELRHFGRFGEADFNLARGINLVSGANEAGKSTLMEAIPAVLFGLRDKERFRPWGRDGSCSAALQLQLSNGNRIQIEREILSDRVVFSETSSTGEVLTTFDGKVSPAGRSSERAIYLGHLERFLGHADEELFRASLFFAQGSLELNTPPEVTARIKAILSGCAEIDYDKILDALSSDYFAITRENPWGKDKAKDRELEEVRARIKELEQRWYALRGSVSAVEELRKKIKELEAGLEQDRTNLAEGRRWLDWVRKQWQLGEKEESLRKDFNRVEKASGKIGELQQERETLFRELTKIGLPFELPEQLPQLLAEGEGLRKALIQQQEEWTRQRKEEAAIGKAPWKGALAISAVILAVSGLAGEGKSSLLAVGGFLSVVVWGVFLRRLFKVNAARSAVQARIDQLGMQRAEVQNALAELEETFRHLNLPSSAIEMVKMEKNLDRHRQIVLRIKEVESALAVLEQPGTVSEEKTALTRELAVLAQRREQERPNRSTTLPAADELPDIEEKLRTLAEGISNKEKELLELTRLEAASQGEQVDPLQIEEEGELLREREQFLLRRKEALALGYDLLRDTVAEFRHAHVDRFAVDIGHYLALLTQHRYETVRLSDDFTPEIEVAGERWPSFDRFSRGAQDAIFFSVRLALTRHLTRGRHLPLLLDDPFVHLDRQRLGEALKLLERIAADHQVVVFSHSENLLRRAERDNWQIVSLDGQREVRPQTVKAKEKEKEKARDDGSQLSLL